jgi:hypothetical protein
MISVALVQEATARHFALTVLALRGQRRSRDVARPRQIAMYLAKELTAFSLPAIGRHFGGRDHTTVIHAVNTVTRLMDVDDGMRSAVEAIRTQLVERRFEQERASYLEFEIRLDQVLDKVRSMLLCAHPGHTEVDHERTT